MTKILLYHNGECFVYKDIKDCEIRDSGILIFDTRDGEHHVTNLPFQVIDENKN